MKYPDDDPLAAQNQNQFAKHAINQQQNKQPELHAPAIRPDDFIEQPMVRLGKVSVR
jgi:hypothetical protein